MQFFREKKESAQDKRQTNKYLRVILIAIVVVFILWNLAPIAGILVKAWGVLFPLILGLCIAFVVNMPLRWIENFVFRRWKTEYGTTGWKVKRAIAILVAYIIIIAIGALLVRLVAPQLVSSLTTLGRNFSYYIEAFRENLYEIHLLDPYRVDINQYLDELHELNIGTMIIDSINKADADTKNNVFFALGTVFSGVVNVVLGIAFSVYSLAAKEKLVRQSRELIYSFFRNRTADRIMHLASITYKNFYNFFTGLFLEALVVGLMVFAGMKVLRLPYPVVIAVLTGFFTLIPWVGGILSAVIGALLILIVDPTKVLPFLIFIIILQQFDANVTYPKIVGSKVGLPSMWVLAAIMIGGGTMGAIGMIICVPIFMTVYELLAEHKNRVLRAKKIDSAIFGPVGPPETKARKESLLERFRRRWDPPEEQSKFSGLSNARKQSAAEARNSAASAARAESPEEKPSAGAGPPN
jgi:predicted PurR-regulated permease PerM